MAGNGHDLPILCHFLLISVWEGVEKPGGGEGLQRAAAGPAAEPPTRAKPVCFDAVETACGRKKSPPFSENGGLLLIILGFILPV